MKDVLMKMKFYDKTTAIKVNPFQHRNTPFLWKNTLSACG